MKTGWQKESREEYLKEARLHGNIVCIKMICCNDPDGLDSLSAGGLFEAVICKLN